MAARIPVVRSARGSFAPAAVAIAALLALAPGSLASSHTPTLSAAFHKSGRQITATGSVGPGHPQGAGERSTWRVRLQQRTHHHGRTRWRTLAAAPLVQRGGKTAYKLTWDAPPPKSKRKVALRVVLVAPGHKLAQSRVHRLTLLPPATVKAKLAAGAHRPPASKVEHVTGDPSGTQTTLLAHGVHVPKVRSALVVNTSPEAPHGLLGIVTSVKHLGDGSIEVTTKPATLDDAYKSFHAKLDGTLGELAEGEASSGPSLRAASLSQLDAGFTCSKPSVTQSIANKIDLSRLHVDGYLNAPGLKSLLSPPGVGFTITGVPTLGLKVAFPANASCQAHAAVKIPIPSTPGLVVKIGPDFKLAADAKVGVDLTWSPHITFGFERNRGGPNTDTHVFKKGGSVNFSGEAQLKLSFALALGISLGGRVGVDGEIGPEITGGVTTQTAPPGTCLTANGDFAANLTAFADAFFKRWDFKLGSWTFGRQQLYRKCAAGGPIGRDASSLAAGYYHTCVVLTQGGIKCWGLNDDGELGYGDTTDRHAPLASLIDVGGPVQQLAPGWRHTCALMLDGKVKCWGANDHGQLGYGDTQRRDAPPPKFVNLGPGRTARQLAVGGDYTCALLDDSSVKCWGFNWHGQLGYGDRADRFAPPPATIDLGVGSASEVATGFDYTCVRLQDGSVKCWGWNGNGQLGYGDGTERDAPPESPVDLGSGRSARQLSLGGAHTCALLDDGNIKCWGYNQGGDLGYGDESDRHAPPDAHIDLGDGQTARQVVAGGAHTCALLEAGTAKCWGINGNGQLGYGDMTAFGREAPPATPIDLGVGRTGRQLSVGDFHSCSLLDNGTVKCWGWNHNGQLGLGDTLDRDAPPDDPINLQGSGGRSASRGAG